MLKYALSHSCQVGQGYPCQKSGEWFNIFHYRTIDKFLKIRYSEYMTKAKSVTHTVSIIRERGQLTIPRSIRANHSWANASSAVTISSQGEEIVIRPKKEVDWDKLWRQMKRVRAFKGNGRGNLSAFIAKDRKAHF